MPEAPSWVLDLCMYRKFDPLGVRKRTRLRGWGTNFLYPRSCDGTCGGIIPETGTHWNRLGMDDAPSSKLAQVIPDELINDVVQSPHKNTADRKARSAKKVQTVSGILFVFVSERSSKCRGGEWIIFLCIFSWFNTSPFQLILHSFCF